MVTALRAIMIHESCIHGNEFNMRNAVYNCFYSATNSKADPKLDVFRKGQFACFKRNANAKCQYDLKWFDPGKSRCKQIKTKQNKFKRNNESNNNETRTASLKVILAIFNPLYDFNQLRQLHIHEDFVRFPENLIYCHGFPMFLFLFWNQFDHVRNSWRHWKHEQIVWLAFNSFGINSFRY